MSDIQTKLLSYFYRFMEKFSLKRLYYRWRAKVPTEHLLASIDAEEFRTLLKYKDDTTHPQYKKYLNVPYWLSLNVARALSLGLNRSKPLSVLDVGSGFGYFPYAAHFYGHEVVAIDVPGDVLFDKASEFLGVDRRFHVIKPKTKLPKFDTKFDLVTAFQVCFNGHHAGEDWGREAWDFFLKDIFKHHMNEGGRVYLELNWSPVIQGWLPVAVRELFLDIYGAKFDGPFRVTLFAPK